MRLLCVDCGLEFPVPEGFFEGRTAKSFWTIHGHYPSMIAFRCACGAERFSGPAVHSNTEQGARNAALGDASFYREHLNCKAD